MYVSLCRLDPVLLTFPSYIPFRSFLPHNVARRPSAVRSGTLVSIVTRRIVVASHLKAAQRVSCGP